jgi:nicotinamidase-related amidase
MAVNTKLIDMAYKEALAKVPDFAGMRRIAKSQSELGGKIIDPIFKAIEKRNEQNRKENEKQKKLGEAQMGLFEKDMRTVSKYLATEENGGYEGALQQSIFNSTYDDILGLQNQYELVNTTGDEDKPENEKERMNLFGKLGARKNKVVELRTIIKTTADAVKNNQTSPTMAGTEDLEVLHKITNQDPNNSYDDVRPYWEKDELYFDVTLETGDTRTVPLSELGGLFTKIPADVQTNLQTISNETITTASKGKAGDVFLWDENVKKNIDALGKDPKAATHIFTTHQHGAPIEGYKIEGGSTGKWTPGSWANALEAHPALNGKYKVYSQEEDSPTYDYDLSLDTKKNVIDKLIATGQITEDTVDTDVDGVITSDEYEAFMDGANRDLAIDAVVNFRNPAHNPDDSALEYGKFRAAQNAALHNENLPKADSSDDDDDTDTNRERWLNQKVDLGVTRLTDKEGNPSNRHNYARRRDILKKQSQIINAKKGDFIEGWDGKFTYRYAYGGEKDGKPFFIEQVWDGDRGEFVDVTYSLGAAGGGGGVKQLSTSQVINALIPQTMLKSKKLK